MKKSYKINEDFVNSRLDRWIKRNICRIPQSLIEKNLRKGKIKVNNKKKNRLPQRSPPANAGKIVGNTTKINPGPPAGSAPTENTVVKIANPANSAIPVSSNKTQSADLRRFCSFRR